MVSGSDASPRLPSKLAQSVVRTPGVAFPHFSLRSREAGAEDAGTEDDAEPHKWREEGKEHH